MLERTHIDDTSGASDDCANRKALDKLRDLRLRHMRHMHKAEGCAALVFVLVIVVIAQPAAEAKHESHLFLRTRHNEVLESHADAGERFGGGRVTCECCTHAHRVRVHWALERVLSIRRA